MQTGKERQTHTQSPIQRELSYPRRSARASDRAQTSSRTPSSPVTSQQSQPSRARQLGMIQVNSVASGTVQAPPFSRRLYQPHRREEVAPHRKSWCVTKGVQNAECAWPSAVMCLRAYLLPQPHRWLWLLVLPLGSGPSRWNKGRGQRLPGPEMGCPSWDARAGRILFRQLAVSPSSVFGLVNHDCTGRQG